MSAALSGPGDASATARAPFVSVIMPVCDEASFLDRALDAVFAQDYPSDRFEVIVADGMSKDGTRELVRRRQEERGNLLLIDNPRRIVPTAMNAALAKARGEIVIRVDGHCEIAPDYVSRCVAHLAAGSAEGVGGAVETVGQTPAARAIALAMSSRFGVGDSSFRVLRGKSVFADTVPFPAYPRTVIDRAGPYDEELVRNQDDEYNYRLRKLGARLLLASDVRSVYYSRSSLTSLWRQYFQYGFWKVRVLQKHPGQMRARQFAPPLLVAGLAVAAAAAPFWPPARRALAAGALAYAAGIGAAAVKTARGADRGLAPRVGLAFATLHFAYGAGFWKGLFRFRNRWGRGRTDPS